MSVIAVFLLAAAPLQEAPPTSCRARAEALRKRSRQDLEDAGRLKAKARGELARAEAILAAARSSPDDPGRRRIVEDLGPKAVDKANKAVVEAEALEAGARARLEVADGILPGAADAAAAPVLDWLGRAMSGEVDALFSKDPGFASDGEAHRRIAGLIERLRPASLRPDAPVDVRILKGEVRRMAAATGGVVYVEEAYLKLKPSDDELLFVLGHELAHAHLRHGVRTVVRRAQEAGRSDIAALAATDPQVAEWIREMALRAVTAERDRADESAADVAGAFTALGAGASMDGLRAFLTRLENGDNKRLSEASDAQRKRLTSTDGHPPVAARKRLLEAVLAEKL